MKFFINDPQKVVDEGIEGLLTDPKLTKLDNFHEITVVFGKNIKPGVQSMGFDS